MILDFELQVSKGQVVTADAGSTDVLDMGTAGMPFTGVAMCFLVSIKTAADFTTGDESYSFVVQTDDNSAFSSPTTVTTYTRTAAQLAVNKNIVVPVPVDAVTEQYLRLYYDVGGTTPSMTIDAILTPVEGLDLYKAYADNSAIQ